MNWMPATQPHIPSPRVDPAALPPVIRTSEPGSFAATRWRCAPRRSCATRRRPPPTCRTSTPLDELHAELTGGLIRALHETAPDVAFWNATAAAYLGRSWLDVPWYWAEAYFYRRLLEAVRYFQPGPWQGVDPYASTKRREWAAEAAPAAVGAPWRRCRTMSRRGSRPCCTPACGATVPTSATWLRRTSAQRAARRRTRQPAGG